MHAKSITLMASIVVAKRGFYLTFHPECTRATAFIARAGIVLAQQDLLYCTAEPIVLAQQVSIVLRTMDNCPPAVRMFTNNGTKDLIDICCYVNR